MKKVYIINGQTGEYGDYQEWIVGVTSNKTLAHNFVTFMNKKLENSRRDYDIRKDLTNELYKYDQNIVIDYTGTEYSFTEYELDSIPSL